MREEGLRFPPVPFIWEEGRGCPSGKVWWGRLPQGQGSGQA